jgi:hypothetical protein
VAKSPSEQIRELTVQVGILTERDETRQREINRLRDDLDREREERIRLQLENASLKQQLQDHIRQVELWDSRRWGLIVLLVGAVFSLASGLVVTLVRR